MHTLICESKKNLLGSHISKFQKIFEDATFNYTQNTLEAIDELELNGNFYSFILCREDENGQVKGEDIYKMAKSKKVPASFILISDASGLETEILDDFYCFNENYTTGDLSRVMDILVAKSVTP